MPLGVYKCAVRRRHWHVAWVDTWASAMQVERADDGSMLVTFEMPQMPCEGYYSMSAMDLVTSDAGYANS